jgi:hypothetical protein
MVYYIVKLILFGIPAPRALVLPPIAYPVVVLSYFIHSVAGGETGVIFR